MPTDPADRLREAAAVLTAVDQYLAHAIAVLPEPITDHQWDSVAEIPTGIRKTLAALLERAAKSHAAALVAAANVFGSATHADALAWLETATDRHALAVADAILGEAVAP